MDSIKKIIAGKELAKFIKIPGELKNKELEIIIRPVIKKKKGSLRSTHHL